MNKYCYRNIDWSTVAYNYDASTFVVLSKDRKSIYIESTPGELTLVDMPTRLLRKSFTVWDELYYDGTCFVAIHRNTKQLFAYSKNGVEWTPVIVREDTMNKCMLHNIIRGMRDRSIVTRICAIKSF